MSKESEMIKKLAAVVKNQQKIINKLAQELPNAFPVQTTTKNESQAIWKALPLEVSSAVDRLEVHGNVVKVRFKPGKATDRVFNAIQRVVQDLQVSNVLPGSSYTVQEV